LALMRQKVIMCAVARRVEALEIGRRDRVNKYRC